jgi:hypothetical protein
MQSSLEKSIQLSANLDLKWLYHAKKKFENQIEILKDYHCYNSLVICETN